MVLTRPPDALTTPVNSRHHGVGSKDVTVSTAGDLGQIQVGMTVSGRDTAAERSWPRSTARRDDDEQRDGERHGQPHVREHHHGHGRSAGGPRPADRRADASGRDHGTPLENIQNEVQAVSLVNDSQGTFQLTLDGAITSNVAYHTTDISWDAPAAGPGSVEDAVNNLLTSASISGSVHVAQTGTSYAITFDTGGVAATAIDTMTATLSGAVAERGHLGRRDRRRRLLAGDRDRADVHADQLVHPAARLLRGRRPRRDDRARPRIQQRGLGQRHRRDDRRQRRERRHDRAGSGQPGERLRGADLAAGVLPERPAVGRTARRSPR